MSMVPAGAFEEVLVTVRVPWKRARTESLHLAGSFNGWSPRMTPLLRDGEHWVAEVRLPPGGHEMMLVVDGAKWQRVPGLPRSGSNSVLRVVPESWCTGPDGITWDAICHAPGPFHVTRIDQRRVRLRILTRAGQARSVRLVSGEKSTRMQRLSRDGVFDEWAATVVAGSEYSFEINGVGWGSFPLNIIELPLPQIPEWAFGRIFYQIFPDRFAPTTVSPEWNHGATEPTVAGWRGGTLDGARKQLEHLRQLGVSGLYMTPVFAAESYHAYDTEDYFNVDSHFGTNGDLSALVQECHESGIRVILDGVFNHSGPEFLPFQDLVQQGEKSRYRDWFFPLEFPLRAEPGQNTYRSWSGVWKMPKLNQDDPKCAEYFVRVGRNWIEEAGIDGWRLDVADEVSPDFWKRFRAGVREESPDTFLLAETWRNARTMIQGDQFDSAMNYPLRDLALRFFAEGTLSNARFHRELKRLQSDYPAATLNAMFNLLSSHDTPRLRTRIGNDPWVEKMLYGFLLSYPGIPCIYYGEEVGMQGGADPDCRRPMDWSRESWDLPHLNFLQHLIRLRNSLPVLHRGDYRPMTVAGRFGFRRKWKNEEFWALFCKGSKKKPELPDGFQILVECGDGPGSPNFLWAVRRT